MDEIWESFHEFPSFSHSHNLVGFDMEFREHFTSLMDTISVALSSDVGSVYVELIFQEPRWLWTTGACDLSFLNRPIPRALE